MFFSLSTIAKGHFDGPAPVVLLPEAVTGDPAR
jgi:hypothetical protein